MGEVSEIPDSSESWPKPDEYGKLKSWYLKEVAPLNRAQLAMSGLLWEELGDNVCRERVVDMLNNFKFGVYMVRKRFNNKHDYPITKFDYKNDASASFAYADSSNGDNYFTVNVEFLKKIALNSQYPQITITQAETAHVRIDNFCEIAGIEEGAHWLLDIEKPGFFKRTPPKTPSDFSFEPTKYAAQNHEQRALLWQLSYLKRYFPEYYEQTRSFYHVVKSGYTE